MSEQQVHTVTALPEQKKNRIWNSKTKKVVIGTTLVTAAIIALKVVLDSKSDSLTEDPVPSYEPSTEA